MAEHFPVRCSGQPVSLAGNTFLSFILGWSDSLEISLIAGLLSGGSKSGYQSLGAKRKGGGEPLHPIWNPPRNPLAEWPLLQRMSQLLHADGEAAAGWLYRGGS